MQLFSYLIMLCYSFKLNSMLLVIYLSNSVGAIYKGQAGSVVMDQQLW